MRASLLAALLLTGCGGASDAPEIWYPPDLAAIKLLSLAQLPPLPDSPGNPVADDPRAVDLGHRLFFDTRLSANGAVACANCHQPAKGFKDGLPLARGIGVTPRKSMTVVGAAYSPWLFWDGRADSLWSQALQPLEDAAEHGANRVELARAIASDPDYRRDYEALFGRLPALEDETRFPPASPKGNAEQRAAWEAMNPDDREDVSMVFANIGRALEAYQRRLQFGPSRFDAFADALLAGDQARAETILNAQERGGLRLFIGRANCLHCHNGPLFTNNEFHNTGVDDVRAEGADRGRIVGVEKLQADDFNCLGSFSPATREQCAELRFVKTVGDELDGAFRTVTLRNIAGTGPFMHNGRFKTLTEVVEHYNLPPQDLNSGELQPLRLTPEQIAEVVAFLKALSGPLTAPPELLQPPKRAQSKAATGA